MRCLFALVFGLALLVATASPSSAETTSCVPADRCCKICDKGMACGNSCISRDKTCHKGPGCARSSTDVCQE